MKYLAHIENNLDSKIVSIYDVINGLNGENPAEWEERTYFSLWYNTPMIAKVNSAIRKPHFAFKKGFGGNENSGGGESIEHQLSKKVIYDLKFLNIKIGDLSDILKFSEVIIEQPFQGGLYKADLYCKIKSENKFNFPIDSMLVIELHYTNKIKKSKTKFYRDNNIAAIEIDIWNKIKFEGNVEVLQKQLIGYFKKQKYAKRLHDPNWKEIVSEKRKKEEAQRQKNIEKQGQINSQFNEKQFLREKIEEQKHEIISSNKITEVQKSSENKLENTSMNTTKNKILKKLGIIFLPSLFWVVLTALGFGAQSLANLIELFAIFILSLVSSFLPERVIQFKYLLVILFLITFLSRLFMPVLPE